MKLTAFLLLGFLIQVSATSFSQTVTFAGSRVPLTQVFAAVKQQTGYVFFYNTSLLETGKPVTIEVRNMPLKAFLQKLAEDQPLQFMIKQNGIIVGKKEAGFHASTGIPFTELLPITGIITDPDGKGLAGISVGIKGSRNITVTDADGRFSVIAGSGDVLVVTGIGYESREVKVGEQLVLAIQLKIRSSNLDTAAVSYVSNGYQVLPKERATGSFAQVDNKLYNRRAGTQIIDRLEGIVPGLLFNRNTQSTKDINLAGQTSSISIRGVSTLYANDQPLVIIDNFPYEGNLNNINPNDVENVTVLKDAAAASIWGVRSGNGVIVITTKKGKLNNKVAVEFNSNLTVGNKPDVFYSRAFLPSNEAINNEKLLFDRGVYDADLISRNFIPVTPVVRILADKRAGMISESEATAKIDALRTVDVRNELSRYFYQQSINQQYAINLKGGNSNSSYYLSGGYDRNRGGAVGDAYKRVTISSGAEFNPVKNLVVTASLNYMQSTTIKGYDPGKIMIANKELYPYAQLADASGNALPFYRNYNIAFTDTAGRGKFLDWKYRPLNEIKYADNSAGLIDNRINAGVRYNFSRSFSADLKYQYENTNGDQEIYLSDSTYEMRDMINLYTQVLPNGALSYPVPLGGRLQKTGSAITAHQGRAQVNFNHSWNDRHDLTAIAGAEINQTIRADNSDFYYGYDKNTGNSYANTDFQTAFRTATGSSRQLFRNGFGFSRTTDRYLSYIGNAAYTFKKRYIVSGSARVDKSNMFGVNTNQKAVPLFSTGLAWNLNKESFYQLNWLPYLKIRATYGYTANINKRATAVTTIRASSAVGSTYSGLPYATPYSPGNPDLRWEKTRMMNWGIDFGLKNDVLTGSLEYYTKKGTDVFGYASLAPSTGVSQYLGNTALTAGHGIDITLNSRNINGKDFQWTTNFILTNTVDRVVSYGLKQSAGSIIGSNSINLVPAIGRPLYGIYSYRWAGLNPQTGDPQGYLLGKVSTDYSGIIKNASNIDSLQYHGPARPGVFGSLRNTFIYHRFSLSANILYKLNYYYHRALTLTGGLPYAGYEDYFNRWQKPGDEQHTSVPSKEPYPPYNSNRTQFYYQSAALVENGSHVRLQDINISYTLDKTQISRLPFSQLQVYGFANNLGILWKASHAPEDPDLGSSSNFINIMPIPTSFSLGVKATF